MPEPAYNPNVQCSVCGQHLNADGNCSGCLSYDDRPYLERLEEECDREALLRDERSIGP